MILKATEKEVPLLANLALELWPGHGREELDEEFRELTENEEAACFLYFLDGVAAAFAQCQLRRDYVEGTDSSPVGYLEGIFVSEGFRGRGIARQLLSACENWAKEKGCREFASDCELTNTQSLAFHLKSGFAEANRIICFVKPL